MAGRGALEAMLTVTGQEAFAASMKAAMASVKELGATADAVSKQMLATSVKMDEAFGAQRLRALQATNRELGVTKGHLSNIVGMLGGKGVVAGFGLYEAIKVANQQSINQMQWVTEAGVRQSQVAGLSRIAGRQAGLGISNVQAGQIIRQIESAYGGNAPAALIQQYLSNSSNLQAISGGRVSALDAASTLIPLLQADKSLGSNPTLAAAQINALVSSGNMQTADVMSVLKTGVVGTLSGLGMSFGDLAPFFAFGADTRSGQQAAPFARLLTTSLMNLGKGGVGKAGQAALARLMPGVDIRASLAAPNGAVNTMEALYAAVAAQDGGLGSSRAKSDISNIFGGVRGGQGPLALAGNYDLFLQKVRQYNEQSGAGFYANASAQAQKTPQQQWRDLQAGLSNTLGTVGTALLPALTRAAPELEHVFSLLGSGPVKETVTLLGEAFKWLANPVVFRTVEALGAIMLAGKVANLGAGLVGGLQGRFLTAGSTSGMLGNSFMNPMTGYRRGLNGAMEAGLAGAVGSGGTMMFGPEAEGAVRNMGRVEGAANSLRTALVGNGLGVGLGVVGGAGVGYASTAGGGSLISGGLTGALTGALMGMSAGPWGAAAGIIGGAAGAIVGHFQAMSKAAAANAQAVNASLTQIAASGTSAMAVVGSGLTGAEGQDLQLAMRNMGGLTQSQLSAAAGNTGLLAKYRAMASKLPKAQRNAMNTQLDILAGMAGATRLHNEAIGQGAKNTPFWKPDDEAVLAWAVKTGELSPMTAAGRHIIPRSTSSVTDALRQKYATAQGLDYSKSTGFAPPTGTTINVYPSARMDELTLAKMVAEEQKKLAARR